jgi:hypothetical protein
MGRYVQGEIESPAVGFDSAVESLLAQLGFSDSVIIQMLISLTRRARGRLLRLVPYTVRHLNSKMGWSMDPVNLSSIYTMIYGNVIDFNKVSTRFSVDIEITKCLFSLMCAPYTSELKFNQVKEIVPEGEVYFDEEPTKHDSVVVPGAPDFPGFNSSSSEKVRNPSRQDSTSSQLHITPVQSSPAVDILRYEARPTSLSLKWLGERIKING